MAEELAEQIYPNGLPRGTKFWELEAITGALGDGMARQLIEINVHEQADDWLEEKWEYTLPEPEGRPRRSPSGSMAPA